MLKFGPFEFDQARGVLARDGVPIEIKAQGQTLLSCLLERPGDVVTKTELVERVWQGDAVTDHSVTVAIHALRKLLDDDRRTPRYIQTVHRKGYRFIA